MVLGNNFLSWCLATPPHLLAVYNVDFALASKTNKYEHTWQLSTP